MGFYKAPKENIVNLHNYKNKVLETAQFLTQRIEKFPNVGILTGTGLGNITASMVKTISFSYNDIPNFPLPTVETHKGELVFGLLEEKEVVVMQGRLHLYEGYSPLDVTFPIRVMQELGVSTLIVSNVSGGLNLSYNPGDIMVIEDHINLTGKNPLVGQNNDKWGLRFPDMVNAYDKKLCRKAEKIGKELEISVKKGVYVGLKGPSLETPAEMRFLRIIKADAVGFSTVQEVIAGIHAGMKILGLSVITNINDPDNPAAATLESVIEVANMYVPKMEMIIKKVLQDI